MEYYHLQAFRTRCPASDRGSGRRSGGKESRPGGRLSLQRGVMNGPVSRTVRLKWITNLGNVNDCDQILYEMINVLQ